MRTKYGLTIANYATIIFASTNCFHYYATICFHYYCAVYDECKYSDTFWLVDRTRLFVQYTISLSSLCKLTWKHWAYKMPVRYILSSVWVRLSIFSPLSIIQYVGLYDFSLPISLLMIEIMYILCRIIIIKSEVWTITHHLGLGHETMVSAVCRSIFLTITSVYATSCWIVKLDLGNQETRIELFPGLSWRCVPARYTYYTCEISVRRNNFNMKW